MNKGISAIEQNEIQLHGAALVTDDQLSDETRLRRRFENR